MYTLLHSLAPASRGCRFEAHSGPHQNGALGIPSRGSRFELLQRYRRPSPIRRNEACPIRPHGGPRALVGRAGPMPGRANLSAEGSRGCAGRTVGRAAPRPVPRAARPWPGHARGMPRGNPGRQAKVERGLAPGEDAAPAHKLGRVRSNLRPESGLESGPSQVEPRAECPPAHSDRSHSRSESFHWSFPAPRSIPSQFRVV